MEQFSVVLVECDDMSSLCAQVLLLLHLNVRRVETCAE